MPKIQATMTMDEKKLELDSSDDIKLPKDILKPNQQSTNLTRNDNNDTTNITAATSDSQCLSLNFSTSITALCLNYIVWQEQL